MWAALINGIVQLGSQWMATPEGASPQDLYQQMRLVELREKRQRESLALQLDAQKSQQSIYPVAIGAVALLAVVYLVTRDR